MHLTRPYSIRAVVNLAEKRAIRVEFKDGKNKGIQLPIGFFQNFKGSSGLFPYVWLRDCSLDQKTYSISHSMKGRIHTMRDFDTNVKPDNIELDENGNCLILKWPGQICSRFDKSWLKTRCPGLESVAQKRRQIYLGRECVKLWDRKRMEKNGEDGGLQRFGHNEFMENDKALHDFLTAVCVDGIAVLKGATEGEGNEMLEQIVKRIGLLERNHFGDIFGVFPKPDASNMAYANTAELPYHTDFPSLEHPPNLQMLHMKRRAECGGGLSMFVDGFHVGELMSQLYPEHFRLLASIPLEFIEEGFDVHKLMDGTEERYDFDMVARHKTFKLDGNKIVKVQYGNVMRSWFIDIDDPMLIQQIYEALKTFTQLCYAPENQLIFPLETGDTVLWANTRLLHARSSYRLLGIPEKERHVIGCYFCWDIVKSKIRLLRDQLDLPENQSSI